MRKSLPKMPRSGPSSRVAPLPAAFLPAGAGQRRGADGNGRVHRHASVAVTTDGRLESRLELLEGFLSHTDLADCSQHALQWLANVLHLTQSLCLVRPPGAQTFVAV